MENEIQIENLNKKGVGVGFHLSTRVEVFHTIPGDRVLVELRKKRKGVIRGKLLKILKPSPDRVEARCEHASNCGGCAFQEMNYAAQLRYKEKIILDLFKDTFINPIIAAEDIFHYRNKMEFTFSQNSVGEKFLGLMISKNSHYVFNLRMCSLVSDWFSALLLNVKKWWDNSSFLAYNPIKNTGALHSLTLRESTFGKMVILTLYEEINLESFISTVQKIVSDASIFVRYVKIEPKVATQIKEVHLAGPDHIEEVLFEKLKIKISPSSFFQPNTRQAQKLYRMALQMVCPSTSDIVYDLYCGSGAFGMIFSKFVDNVIGIELNSDAVNDARTNLLRNNITNYDIYNGDVGKVLTTLSLKKPTIVIVDPPRAGLGDIVLAHLKALAPKIILYVSCNPYTQVEDIKKLESYKLKSIQPLDQFPHTQHIENIALLTCQQV